MPRPITYQGETRYLATWAALLGWDVNTLVRRLERLPFDDAMQAKTEQHAQDAGLPWRGAPPRARAPRQ